MTPPSADRTTQDATLRQDEYEQAILHASMWSGMTNGEVTLDARCVGNLARCFKDQAEALEQARPHLRHRHRCAHIQTSKGACDCGLDAALTTIAAVTGRK